MTKNKLVRIIVVCVIAIAIIVAIAVLRPISKPPKSLMLVTAGCIDRATNSLKVQGNVTNIGGVLLSRRGFVYMQGTEGDPELNIIPLVNPSFEAGALLEGWTCRNSTQVSRGSDAKVGNYSLKYQYPGGGDYPFVAAQTLLSRTEWAGKTVTVGAWVKSTDNSTYLGFTEWGGGGWWSTGSYHPGDGQWHWLTCTATIPNNLTADWTVIICNWNTTASYEFWVDGVMLVEGPELLAVFDDGEFSEGSYSLIIDNLEPDTWYSIRAFGENEAGIGYGDVVTCKTLE